MGTLLLGKTKQRREKPSNGGEIATAEEKAETRRAKNRFKTARFCVENYADLGFSVEFLRESGLCSSVQRNGNGFCSFSEEEEEKEEENAFVAFCIDFEEDTAKDVVGKLGEPTSKGGTGVQIFIVYEMLGIKISFNALDWENAGASIHSMAVWKASD